MRAEALIFFVRINAAQGGKHEIFECLLYVQQSLDREGHFHQIRDVIQMQMGLGAFPAEMLYMPLSVYNIDEMDLRTLDFTLFTQHGSAS